MVKVIKTNINSVLGVLKTNLPDNINNIINNYIREGTEIYDKNKITHPDIDKYPQQDELFNNWNYPIYINCNILYYKNISINCVLSNKVITSIYSNFLNILPASYQVYTYYVFSEGDNTCILVCGDAYNLPCFIYYVYRHLCLDLINAPFGNPYGDAEHYKKIINMLITDKNICSIIENSNYIPEIYSSKKTVMSFANNYMAGHYLWNEASGIDILIKTNLIKEIDILLLGDYDICDMHKLIEEYNPTCKIVNIKDKDTIVNADCNIIYGIISGHFILETSKKMYLKNVNHINVDKKFVFMIIIKADRRCIHDIENVYIQLINELVKKNILIPNETLILFDGLYFNSSNEFLKKYYDTYNGKYNNIIKDITSNIHNDFECKSLIGTTFLETLRYYKSIDFWIAPQSSAMELINQTNDNGLIITPENLKYCTQQQCYYIENRIRHDVSFATVSYVDNLTIVNWHDIYEKVERKILYLKTKTK